MKIESLTYRDLVGTVWYDEEAIKERKSFRD